MVHNLSLPEWTADCIFCDDAVQVHSFIGHIMGVRNVLYIVAYNPIARNTKHKLISARL